MARTAYLMDRLMARVGLSGKSFIPLLSSFACAVPGVMATRVIENERDRLTTILVAPLLTCSARLPIYALLIAAFIPGTESYLGGLAALCKVDVGGLVSAGNPGGRGGRLAVQADDPSRPDAAVPDGTAQLQVALAADGVFPHGRAGLGVPALRRHVDLGRVDPGLGRPLLSARSARHPPAATAQQLPGPRRTGDRAGVKPLGWDWRIGCAVLASLPAREIVVATLGVMYHLDDEPDDRLEDGERAMVGKAPQRHVGRHRTGPCLIYRWRCRSWCSSRSAPSVRPRWR